MSCQPPFKNDKGFYNKVVNFILGKLTAHNNNPSISIKRDLSNEDRRSNSIFVMDRYRLRSEEGDIPNFRDASYSSTTGLAVK